MPVNAPDFDRAFAPGARHAFTNGDVATVRWRKDISLWLPSGRVVAGQPFRFDLSDGPFIQQVEPGQYPLLLVLASFAQQDSLPACEIVAAAGLVIRDEPVASWEMAVCDGQDVAELTPDEFFGYPVDGGVGSFVDAASLDSLCEDYDDYLDRLTVSLNVRGTDDTAPATLTDDAGRPLLVAFPSGDGDGYFPTWVGRTAAGDVGCFLTDFCVLTEGDDHHDDRHLSV